MIRRQLPAYSPVRPSQLGAAFLEGLLSPSSVLGKLEEELRTRFGADHIVLTGSGTQALQLALASWAAGSPGRPPVAALPAYACFDLVTAAVGAQVAVSFYDVDPETLSPDMASLRAALDAGAGAVVAAPLYGFPLDWTAVRRECDRAGALLIEDSAQGLGSGWGGAEGGAFGDLTILSFGRGKGWSGGGGGALLARGEAAASLGGGGLGRPAGMAGTKAFALSTALWALGRPSLYRLPSSLPGLALGETHYKEPAPATAMSPVVAAIVRGHREASAAVVGTRRAWARAWTDVAVERGWAGSGLVPCRPLAGGDCGYLRYPVLADSRETRDAFVGRARDFGAAAGYPVPLPRLAAEKAVPLGSGGPTPGAEALASRLITLPTHPRVSDRDVRELGGR